MITARSRALTSLFLATSLGFTCSIHAQVAGATLSGTVTDVSGARVSGAKIGIQNIETGVQREIVTSDSASFYSAPNLLPGTYDITVTAAGFSTYVRTGVSLTVGSTTTLNIALQVGSVAEKVEVIATPSTVQLDSSAISAVVGSTTVRELPLNGRDWTQLATLQPGVVSIHVEAPASDRGNRGFGSLLTINGHPPFENNYRVNGVSINDYSNGSPGSTQGVNLGVDAIQEFSVLTSNYPAEYGRASGGVINSITKSGTSQFHGDAYWFLRDKILDAQNYFDNGIPPFHRHQFGASVGGPIIKRKTFFFADYEGIIQNKSNTYSNPVPSAAARAGTLCSQPDGTCTTTTITIDPKVSPFLGFYPLPNAGLIGNGDIGISNTSEVERLRENYVTARGDQHFSDKDSLNASWFYDRAPLTSPDNFGDVVTQNFTLRQMASVEETHIFNPGLVNTARIGYSRVNALISAPVNAINPLAKDPTLGAFPGVFAPQLNVPGLATLDGALGSVSEDVLNWNSYQVYDDAFLTRGTHSVKFGFAAEHMQNHELSGAGANGIFSFPSLAGFLQNQPSFFQLDDPTGTKPINVRQTLFGAYIQDDWHWRSNFTLNLGVRYEPVTLPTEAHDGFAVLKNITDPAETSVKHLWAKNQTLRNLEPRVGFAWDPFRDGKSAVRAAFGIYDVLPLPWVYTHGSTSTLPFGRLAGNAHLAPGSFPNGALGGLGFDPTTVANRYVEQAPHRNYAMNWNLSLQREITPGLAIVVAYVGAHNLHQAFSTDDSNMVIPTLTPAGYLWPCGPDGNGNSCVAGFLPTGTQTNPIPSVRLNPDVGPIRLLKWDGSSHYEGFQVGVMKTMSHGIQAQASYTRGQCVDMGSGGLLGDPYKNSLSSLMFFNRQSRHGLCDFNVTHNFVANALWHAPKPNFGGLVGEHLLSDWEFGGVFNANTGEPITLVMAGDPLGQGSSDPWPYPSRVAAPGCDKPVNPGNVHNYLKLNCFTPPIAPASLAGMCQPGVDAKGNPIPGSCMNLFGNNGRTSVIGPGLVSLDFSAVKNNFIERISGTFNLQLRAEFFNIMNHPNFQPPLDNKALFNQDGSPVTGAGAIDATSTTSRQIQLALKAIW
ncbi:MAG: TonB-dependent receptor plug [Acidobacteriaceae bacterium]|nr:TonB-dependent receptor plug [Acidobacteriaceae bacterium]